MRYIGHLRVLTLVVVVVVVVVVVFPNDVCVQSRHYIFHGGSRDCDSSAVVGVFS